MTKNAENLHNNFQIYYIGYVFFQIKKLIYRPLPVYSDMHFLYLGTLDFKTIMV